MIQTQFNSTIKTLRTDHGGEYTYLLFHDISHQFSCPFTPELNGIAERKNRHILEIACTLLHHASLRHQFWPEATSTATYLFNRFPTKTLYMQSPCQKLYNKSPSFPHLKTFGCLCYPWTAYTRSHKLNLKSSHCIFLGYSTDHKGFRCFDYISSKLIISRHVRFDEHEFLMETNPPTPQSPQISTVHNTLQPPLLPTFYPPSTTSLPTPNQPITTPPPFSLPATPIFISNTNAAAFTLPLYPPPPSLLSYSYPNKTFPPPIPINHHPPTP